MARTGNRQGHLRSARQAAAKTDVKIRLTQFFDRRDAVVERRMGGKKTAASAAAGGPANPGERVEQGVFAIADAL